MEWLPIASAPKDGRPFLAWLAFDGGCPDMHAVTSWDKRSGTWRYMGSFAYGGFCEGFIATHWMHLPEPPPASGIETGTAKSEALSAKHESPTLEEGDAQNRSG